MAGRFAGINRGTTIAIVASVVALAAGCGKSASKLDAGGSWEASPQQPTASSSRANDGKLAASNGEERIDSPPTAAPHPAPAMANSQPRKSTADATTPATKRSSPPRSLADLVAQSKAPPSPAESSLGGNTAAPPAGDVQPAAPSVRKIDDARAAAAGIRHVTGRHLTLYTDLPASPDVDELPAVFDLAVPQWCEYFGIDPQRTADWKLVGYLMQASIRFRQIGVLAAELPDFPHGWQQGREIWVYEQPSVYYRRHLLLHEGTHAFMSEWLGGLGPPWYAEGMAELLATHAWRDGKLTLHYMPKNREEVPEWGRVKIIRDENAAERSKSLEEIMQFGPRDHFRVEPYGWCWGAAAFFDNHPRFQQAFRELRRDARDTSGDLSLRFKQRLEKEWRDVSEEWQLFVANIDYGYDVARAAIQRRPAELLPPDGASAIIAADRGWQSSGVRLEAGRSYRISASGRYQIADRPSIWWCEPGGVTIHYHQRLPLGMLLGAISDDEPPLTKITPLAFPDPIGLGVDITCGRSGTLYLRVNESAAALGDNAGEVTVRVVPQ